MANEGLNPALTSVSPRRRESQGVEGLKVCARERLNGSGSAGSKTARARFVEEARVTAQLDHPGIVPVHELGGAGGDEAYFAIPRPLAGSRPTLTSAQ